MRRLVALSLIAGPFLVAAAALPATAQGEVHLTVAAGPGAGEVTLQWTGGQLPWLVHRSTDPALATDPASLRGETDAAVWVDEVAAELAFYQVLSCGPPPAPAPRGCSTCDACDPWIVHWEPVACARSHLVRWKCGTFNPEEVEDVGGATSIDLCLDTSMCDGACFSFDLDYIRVQACNPSGCSSAAAVPSAEIPAACGGGCCFPS